MYKAAALILTMVVSMFAVACGSDDSTETNSQSGNSAAMKDTDASMKDSGSDASMKDEGTEAEESMKKEDESAGGDEMKPEADEAMKDDGN